MKVSVFPVVDYVIEFINTRGITLASHEEDLDVLFYTGKNIKELKEIVKDTNANCVIVNNLRLKDDVGFFWIRHEFVDLSSLCTPGIIHTNTEVLSRELYGMWGLQADIQFTKIQSKKKRPISIISDIKDAMLWG
jgi:hypothetical protein